MQRPHDSHFWLFSTPPQAAGFKRSFTSWRISSLSSSARSPRWPPKIEDASNKILQSRFASAAARQRRSCIRKAQTPFGGEGWVASSIWTSAHWSSFKLSWIRRADLDFCIFGVRTGNINSAPMNWYFSTFTRTIFGGGCFFVDMEGDFSLDIFHSVTVSIAQWFFAMRIVVHVCSHNLSGQVHLAGRLDWLALRQNVKKSEKSQSHTYLSVVLLCAEMHPASWKMAHAEAFALNELEWRSRSVQINCCSRFLQRGRSITNLFLSTDLSRQFWHKPWPMTLLIIPVACYCTSNCNLYFNTGYSSSSR